MCRKPGAKIKLRGIPAFSSSHPAAACLWPNDERLRLRIRLFHQSDNYHLVRCARKMILRQYGSARPRVSGIIHSERGVMQGSSSRCFISLEHRTLKLTVSYTRPPNRQTGGHRLERATARRGMIMTSTPRNALSCAPYRRVDPCSLAVSSAGNKLPLSV